MFWHLSPRTGCLWVLLGRGPSRHPASWKGGTSQGEAGLVPLVGVQWWQC